MTKITNISDVKCCRLLFVLYINCLFLCFTNDGKETTNQIVLLYFLSDILYANSIRFSLLHIKNSIVGLISVSNVKKCLIIFPTFGISL